MQLSTLFLSAITAVVCVNAATIPSGAEANNPANNLVNPLQARSYDYVDPGIEAHLERRSPGYGSSSFINGFGGGGFSNGFNTGFSNGFGGGGFVGSGFTHGLGGGFGGGHLGMVNTGYY
ncbi:hypothetical protein BASA50_003713 [Batrachochytrium salamandrivorans]|uniref:Uncharacterized protein n=1 Tax=Batrachochytrium salamandrivorans TaxID=1357716 RepID=A0ABQ8FI88_9FUNG|nr:hypothetical protein BASA62_005034 [Batrachochytrium salamandrivorans]KAH6572938.1 hypothetical protein BASA60_006350 [Batrachochytrium salamandrivorans]KAH6579984.1 hypothetical protein BASA61_009972 [Batrachochytrium salamandrivorans]KAH6598678.1 hypothetical protein BASA50_003713 [Batrachochytrium salamandrivorans]KAH9267871.1 hypothetical protein BASA83_009696 [Batrachochytrium salamandrivorans]